MSTVRERIAFVRGLIQGAELAGNGGATRDVLEKMLDIFDALADDIEELEAGRLEVEEYLEAIDADLGDLEEEVLGVEFDNDDDGIEGDFVELHCPSCHATVYFEEDLLLDDDEGDLECPECGEVIYRADALDGRDDDGTLS